MEDLKSIPPEILIRIFQSCDDIPQALSLALTCKHCHSVWDSNSAAVIWTISDSNIRAFDDALMAVRATDRVLRAYQAGQRPPMFSSMHELSGVTQKPNWKEFKEVLNMQHLVRCVEHMFHFSRESTSNLFGYSMQPLYGRPEPEPDDTEAWKDRFYGAIYRLLLAGAVLTRAYTEPFFQAGEDGRTGFFDRSANADEQFTDEDVGYLRRFPVYNFDLVDQSAGGIWRESEYLTVFGPFASWIVEDGRTRGLREKRISKYHTPDDEPIDHAEQGAIQELMCLLTAYEHLACKFTNGLKKSRLGRYAEDASIVIKGNARKVSIVLFGVFLVEEITMPAQIEDTEKGFLCASPHPGLKGTEFVEQMDIVGVMDVLQSKTRSLTHNDAEEHPDPPPMFELWNFTLRHYVNLGFAQDSFWMWRECMWWECVGTGKVFYSPDWNIVESYVPSRVSWAERGSDTSDE